MRCPPGVGLGLSLRESRHYRIKPYTPKHNGKVERYNRILAEELLYSVSTPTKPRGAPPSTSGMITTITTDRIQHAEDDRPPLTAGTASLTSVPHTSSLDLPIEWKFHEVLIFGRSDTE